MVAFVAFIVCFICFVVVVVIELEKKVTLNKRVNATVIRRHAKPVRDRMLEVQLWATGLWLIAFVVLLINL